MLGYQLWHFRVSKVKYTNTNTQILKYKVPKRPNMCYIFGKHGIQGYQLWTSFDHMILSSQIQSAWKTKHVLYFWKACDSRISIIVIVLTFFQPMCPSYPNPPNYQLPGVLFFNFFCQILKFLKKTFASTSVFEFFQPLCPSYLNYQSDQLPWVLSFFLSF